MSAPRAAPLTTRQHDVLSHACAGIHVYRDMHTGRLFQGGEYIQERTWKVIRRLFRRSGPDDICDLPRIACAAYVVTDAGRRKSRNHDLKLDSRLREAVADVLNPQPKCPVCQHAMFRADPVEIITGERAWHLETGWTCDHSAGKAG